MPRPPRASSSERYRLKFRRLRRAARALVFENGALCDEVARLEAKWLRARAERRFLLARLLRLRAAAEEAGPGGRRARRSRHDGSRREETAGNDLEGFTEASRPEAAAILEEPSPGLPAAILRPPAGALPLSLGPLTVHSLGAGGAGGAGAILPPGYRSTRLYASTRRAGRKCLYTCRVLAGGGCEVVGEDEPGRVLGGPTPDVCHAQLLQALGEAAGRPRAEPEAANPGGGAEFFGLSHPEVRKLLEGEGGACAEAEEEEEEEEEEAAAIFPYADVFLGSPNGSDE